MAAARPPITCHVLDTTVGLPAPGIAVKLYQTTPSNSPAAVAAAAPSAVYTGTTNADGRVTAWHAPAHHISLVDAFSGPVARDLLWTLEFETGVYWSEQRQIQRPFFPRVILQFVTESFASSPKGTEAHWHVPLLLGPYNYTTYRGS